MSGDIFRDPDWRTQYDVAPKPDESFEREIRCSPQGRVSIPVATQPLNNRVWLAPLHRA